MSYRVEFALGAAVVFHTLPPEGQDVLVARAVDLAEQPWADVVIRRPGDDPAFRETTFGTNLRDCLGRLTIRLRCAVRGAER